MKSIKLNIDEKLGASFMILSVYNISYSLSPQILCISCAKRYYQIISISDYKMKVGDFSLQLVDATTKEPFKEHVAPSDGQVYAGKNLNVVWIYYYVSCSHACSHYCMYLI